MSDFAIRVEKLGKRYRISHQTQRGVKRYTALRDVLAESALAPLKAFWRGNSGVKGENGASSSMEDFWALS
jgi:hypothetical protein